jgi:hypothetical protein
MLQVIDPAPTAVLGLEGLVRRFKNEQREVELAPDTIHYRKPYGKPTLTVASGSSRSAIWLIQPMWAIGIRSFLGGCPLIRLTGPGLLDAGDGLVDDAQDLTVAGPRPVRDVENGRLACLQSNRIQPVEGRQDDLTRIRPVGSLIEGNGDPDPRVMLEDGPARSQNPQLLAHAGIPPCV